MEKIQVSTSRKYNIVIGRDLLRDTGKYVSEVIAPCKVCIITDDVVFNLYENTTSKSLANAGYEVYHFIFNNGEKSKTMNTITSILELLAENNFTRGDAIIALGGGITGDIAGFAASIFLRGIQFVQIPTTFLAAVDSSVGGKTGVNLQSGKNLAGAFWQPSLVLCDCNTFTTLSYETFLDGVAEAIKYGAIINKDLFNLLLSHSNSLFNLSKSNNEQSDNDTLIQIIKQCVCIKRDIVLKDELDTGIRQLLNFGHTIGHAIEKCSNYSITHGHAVALGMIIVSKASYNQKLCQTDCSIEIKKILKQFKFPISCPFTAEQLTQVALKDKKRTGKKITLVVPTNIGFCRLEKMDVSKLENFIKNGL